MDQGVITSFKQHYKKHFLRDRVDRIEEDFDLDISLLDALRMMVPAWDEVTPKTIENCFAKAKFFDVPDEAVCF